MSWMEKQVWQHARYDVKDLNISFYNSFVQMFCAMQQTEVTKLFAV
jgi:hypothetical protein